MMKNRCARLSPSSSTRSYPVATATHGAEALEMVATEHPCVVLLDIRMTVLDGWGFMQALQGREEEPAVLVVTAAQNARQWADEVGADGDVVKPFDPGAVLEEVARLCVARAGTLPQ